MLFVGPEAVNILCNHFLKLTGENFVAAGHHSWLWPKAATSLKSSEPFSWPEAAMTVCGQMFLKSHLIT